MISMRALWLTKRMGARYSSNMDDSSASLTHNARIEDPLILVYRPREHHGHGDREAGECVEGRPEAGVDTQVLGRFAAERHAAAREARGRLAEAGRLEAVAAAVGCKGATGGVVERVPAYIRVKRSTDIVS